jgi:gluconokinase
LPPVDILHATHPLALALDIGTSSARALLFDSRGRQIRDAECQIVYQLTATADGGAEVNPDFLFDLVCQTLDGLLRVDRGEIVAVGVTGFWHSLMGLDRNGTPTTPVLLWADTRSRRDVDEIKQTFDPVELWRRTGCFVHSSYWPGKLRWLRRERPDVFGRTTRWCAFTDYLTWKLFGADRTTVSMASSTALLNATDLAWDELAVSASQIDPATLPVILPQRTAHSGLAAKFAARWPALAGVPWFSGIGDGGCANIGSGGIGPHRIALTVGTSGALRMVRSRLAGTANSAPDSLWTYRLDEDRVVVGAAISNGGIVPDRIAELTGVALDGAAAAEATHLEPDAHGLTILPFLAGERAPLWNDWVTAAIVGMRLATTPAELLRAGIESVSYRLALLYDDLAGEADADHEIVANGGAILRNPAWLQMLADVMRHPIIALSPEDEASARGAALLALEYVGIITSLNDADDPAASGRVIEPDATRGDIYRFAMDRQNRLLDLLYENGRSRLDDR